MLIKAGHGATLDFFNFGGGRMRLFLLGFVCKGAGHLSCFLRALPGYIRLFGKVSVEYRI